MEEARADAGGPDSLRRHPCCRPSFAASEVLLHRDPARLCLSPASSWETDRGIAGCVLGKAGAAGLPQRRDTNRATASTGGTSRGTRRAVEQEAWRELYGSIIGDGISLRIRLHHWPAQRGQVHAAECATGAEAGHCDPQAADHAQPWNAYTFSRGAGVWSCSLHPYQTASASLRSHDEGAQATLLRLFSAMPCRNIDTPALAAIEGSLHATHTEICSRAWARTHYPTATGAASTRPVAPGWTATEQPCRSARGRCTASSSRPLSRCRRSARCSVHWSGL